MMGTVLELQGGGPGKRQHDMKKLIKWAYFKYVYPDDVDRAYRHLEESGYVPRFEVWVPDELTQQALEERKWISDDGLH